MTRAIAILAVAFAISGCASSFPADNDFAEWKGYEIGTTRPPPSSYILDGNEEYCIRWPLSECVYRRDNLSLAYHDGILISKEALTEGLERSSPLIEDLAAAGSREKVIQILRAYARYGEPNCYDVGTMEYPCGVLLKENPSEYVEARFSSEWKLLSIKFNKPDAL